MKMVVDKANSRGYANHGWLKTYHTFSFANYYNPKRVHFGMLRVLNDDTVYLQKFKLLFGTVIEFTVENTCTGTHHLDITRGNGFTVLYTVAMTQIAIQRYGYHFHILMRMCVKAFARSNRIIVQHTQHPEMYPFGIVIICKTKSA